MLRLLAVFLLFSALAARAATPAPVPVLASFTIMADWLRIVGGERVQVNTLIGANQDVHDWQPSPATVRQLAGARLLVVNGLGLDDQVQKLARGSGFRGELLIASTGIKALSLPPGEAEHAHEHEHGHARGSHAAGLDPHAWQDLRLAARYIDNIAAALSRIDPAGAADYARRARAYQAELQKLDAWAVTQFQALRREQRRALVSHDAFAYLARRYDLQLLAVQGKSAEGQASAREVAALIGQIRRTGLKAVFLENTNNARLTTQIARETGIAPGGELYADSLSAAHGPAPDFLAFYRHNVRTLLAGMQRN